MLVMPEEAALAAQQHKIFFDIISDLEKQGLTEELREKIIDVASDIISIDTGISNKIADQSSDVVTNSSLKSTVITESLSLQREPTSRT